VKVGKRHGAWGMGHGAGSMENGEWVWSRGRGREEEFG